MIPRLRRFAVISLPAYCISCNADSDPKRAESVSTSSSNTVTATATATANSGLSASTSSSTVSSVASSAAASSASTNGTGGATTSAPITTSAEVGSAGGAAGAPNASTDGGATSGGVFVIQDSCSHEPCGGALPDRDWRHVRACVTAEQLVGPIQSFCSAITLVGSSGELTGTIAFEDGSFNQAVSFNLSIELDVPAECDITCPSFAASLAVLGFPETTCEESNGGCRCVSTARGTDPRSGDYLTHEANLTLILPFGSIEASYCAGENSFSYALPVMLVPQGTPMDVVYETVPR